MKKIILALILLMSVMPLIGCFEANDETGIKNSFCSNVPINRYQQVIGFESKLRGISRDSAAVFFFEGAKASKKTCDEALADSEMMMILMGILLVGAVSSN